MTYDAGWPCCADFTRLTSENAALRAQLTAAEAIAELHLCTCEREQVAAPHEENCVLGRLIAARAEAQQAIAKRDEWQRLWSQTNKSAIEEMQRAEKAEAEAQQLREERDLAQGAEDAIRFRLTETEAENARLRSELEAVQAESDKWFAIAAAEQDVKALLDRNVKLRKWLESSDGMMANYERLASKYRTERDALQAQLAQAVAALEACVSYLTGESQHGMDPPERARHMLAVTQQGMDALALLRGTREE